MLLPFSPYSSITGPKRKTLGIFILDQDIWIADAKRGCWTGGVETHIPTHCGHTCVHAAGSLLGLWLLQNDLSMTMTPLSLMQKKSYARELMHGEKKRTHARTHINTHVGEISGMIRKKLLAGLWLCKIGEMGCKRWSFGFYLNLF